MTGQAQWVSVSAAVIGSVEGLKVGKFFVNTAQCDKVFMFAPFDDLSFLQDKNFIGMLNGRKAVCDHDGGALCHHFGQGVLHKAFRFGVKRRSGFVEDEDEGILEHGSGNYSDRKSVV